ncbi:MAG: cell division protein FtsX [Candidatus Polarisedimenticolia bacterium]
MIVLREALRSLWRARGSNLVTVGIIAAALAVLGGFLVLVENLRPLADAWDRVQINAYLADRAVKGSPAEVERLVESLRSAPDVREVRYVSREEALAIFREAFPDLAGSVASLSENPFPASIEVALRGMGDERRRRTRDLLQSLAASPLVESVQDNDEEARRVLGVLTFVSRLGFGLGLVLAAASVFIIFNVIRLTIVARRDEIAIMRLVGATPRFIRGPFLAEGMLQGVGGALAAMALLYAGHLALSDYAARSSNQLAATLSARFLPWPTILWLAAGGLLIGLVGSALSLRRFLSEATTT